MRTRNVKNAKELINKSDYFIKDPKRYKGKYSELFNNKNRINLEIGCGKGSFLTKMASIYKDINFIGVERSESILLRAINKADELELNNLYFMCMDAKELNEVFDKEIDTIYLNFSDPWPKKRHEKRRLTHESFLKVYDDLFKGNSKIEMKTDNDSLFAYSLVSFSKFGYTLDNVSLDLANEDIDNVLTEYEEKFTNKGFKIKYVKVNK